MSGANERGRPISAMLVTDDATLRTLARRVLPEHGFAVVLAETGEEALETYAASSPDVVLLDSLLPDLDGFEWLRRLRELHGELTVPVLMFTEMNDRQSVLRGYQAGVSDFLEKPLQEDVLAHRSLFAVEAHRNKLDLKRSEAMLRRAQQAAQMGSWEYDIESEQMTWSDETYRIFGLQPDQCAASAEIYQAHIFPGDLKRVFCSLRESIDLRKSFSIEHRIVLADGEIRHIRQLAEPVSGRSPDDDLWVGTIQDITDQASALERIRFLADYDRLTGLPNRNLFKRQLNESVVRARLRNEYVGVLFLGIDRFARINDTLGHNVGDRLLSKIVERIQDAVRNSDPFGPTDASPNQSTLGRSVSDEFILLFPNVGRPENAAHLARRMLALLQEPFEIDDTDVTVTGSIGVAIYPIDGLDIETLIRNAATSMHCAKKLGGNNIQFFSGSETTDLIKKTEMERHLRAALERKEFELHYQPKIELATGAVVGFEGLLRWKSPELGLVSPAEFIPLAEATGLIDPIGRWVIDTACRTSKKWERAGLRQVPIAVNISPQQFGGEDLYELISQILAEHELNPRWLDIEITETAMMRDEKMNAATLEKLRKDGLLIALDDFGTGYSSLSYLKRFPIDILKIDRSFVTDLPDDPDAAGITQAIIAMARVLGLTVIAEGVETEAQRDFLASLGCDQMQGFLVSPARPEEEVIRFLEPGLSVFA